MLDGSGDGAVSCACSPIIAAGRGATPPSDKPPQPATMKDEGIMPIDETFTFEEHHVPLIYALAIARLAANSALHLDDALIGAVRDFSTSNVVKALDQRAHTKHGPLQLADNIGIRFEQRVSRVTGVRKTDFKT